MGHGAAILAGFSFPVFTPGCICSNHAHRQRSEARSRSTSFSHFGRALADRTPVLLSRGLFSFSHRLCDRWELLEWGLAQGFVRGDRAGGPLSTIFLLQSSNCWFAPALMVGVHLGLFFDYAPPPSHPVKKARWHNAAGLPQPLDDLPIMGQNYHSWHHLWPLDSLVSVSTGLLATKPLLEAKGSPSVWDCLKRATMELNFSLRHLSGNPQPQAWP